MGIQDIDFGLWVGAERRAGAAEVRADGQEELAKMWKKTARMAKDKLNSSAAEADAGLAVVDAIMQEIAEIDKNPEKARFFSDPNNRLSRTNLFKKVKEEREKKYSDTTLGEMPATRINKEPNSK